MCLWLGNPCKILEGHILGRLRSQILFLLSMLVLMNTRFGREFDLRYLYASKLHKQNKVHISFGGPLYLPRSCPGVVPSSGLGGGGQTWVTLRTWSVLNLLFES